MLSLTKRTAATEDCGEGFNQQRRPSGQIN